MNNKEQLESQLESLSLEEQIQELRIKQVIKNEAFNISRAKARLLEIQAAKKRIQDSISALA